MFQNSSTKPTVNPFKSKSQNLFDLKTRSKSEADRGLYDQFSKPSFQKTVSHPFNTLTRILIWKLVE